ncbi:unnamed protein product [Wuchereria bancrofti]|nr:unnamed protein product [Wuchereria bancrofti]
MQNIPQQRQTLQQHDDIHGFDDYDEEDFRRDTRDNSYESRGNYHY